MHNASSGMLCAEQLKRLNKRKEVKFCICGTVTQTGKSELFLLNFEAYKPTKHLPNCESDLLIRAKAIRT